MNQTWQTKTLQALRALKHSAEELSFKLDCTVSQADHQECFLGAAMTFLNNKNKYILSLL